MQYRHKGSQDSGIAELRRHGRCSREYLLLRSYVNSLHHGRCEMAPCIAEPIAMNKGKTSWNIYPALTAFAPDLRSQGHQGIGIHSYCFDRGLYSGMMRRLRVRHRLACDVPGPSEADFARETMASW